MEVYLEPVLPTPELVVVGDLAWRGTLVEMAGILGWRSRSIDNPDLGLVGEGGTWSSPPRVITTSRR